MSAGDPTIFDKDKPCGIIGTIEGGECKLGLEDSHFLQLLKEMKDLYNRKNAGYAGIGEQDPYKNFRYSEMFGVSPFKGSLIRMSDKYVRISNLIKNPNADQVGESIRDTLMDMSVYCLIAICLYEEENNIVTKGV